MPPGILNTKIETFCKRCNTPITIANQNQRYCSDCRKIINTEQSIASARKWYFKKRGISEIPELGKCRDCGASIETSKQYCEECKKSHRKHSYNKANWKYRRSCCNILEKHHELLKDDPERLTTEFIKNMARCSCDKEIESF